VQLAEAVVSSSVIYFFPSTKTELKTWNLQ